MAALAGNLKFTYSAHELREMIREHTRKKFGALPGEIEVVFVAVADGDGVAVEAAHATLKARSASIR